MNYYYIYEVSGGQLYVIGLNSPTIRRCKALRDRINRNYEVSGDELLCLCGEWDELLCL